MPKPSLPYAGPTLYSPPSPLQVTAHNASQSPTYHSLPPSSPAFNRPHSQDGPTLKRLRKMSHDLMFHPSFQLITYVINTKNFPTSASMGLMSSSGASGPLCDDVSTFILFAVDGDHNSVSSFKIRNTCTADARKEDITILQGSNWQGLTRK